MATLNLHNPEGLYSGGSVNVNALPYARLAMEARERNKAREDAVNKYYERLPETINDKGVRDIEIPVIEDYKKKIYEFGIKNRELLKKGDGAAKLGLDQLIREATSVARKSQNAAKTDLLAGKSLMNKDNQFILNSESYVKDHAAHNLPVTDPNYKELDLTKYAADRPFDESKFVKDIKGKFPYSEKVVREADPTDKNYEIVTTLPVLDNKAKEQMVTDAADRFHNDPIFAKKIATDLAGTGQLQGIVKIAQEQFGLKDPTQITDELIAAAYTYSKLPVGKTREKVQANYTNREEGKLDTQLDKEKRANAEYDRRAEGNLKRSLIKIAANKQGQDIVNGTSGNAFDEFGGVTPIYLPQSGGKIDKGIVYDKDGNLYNGKLVATKEFLPANVTTSFNSSKIPIPKFMDVVVQDGVIQSIQTPNGIVSRQAMENLQKKSNTEPVKSAQPVYGKPQGGAKAPVSKPAAKPKKDPLNLGF